MRRLLIAAAVLFVAAGVRAEPGDDLVVEARDALRRHDAPRLAAIKAATSTHSLASWVDYWELGNRLDTAQMPEVESFYDRWSGTYVEDRLRNDWLLQLGRRRDWAAFRRDLPRFKMADDREVVCYGLVADHLAGKDVRSLARAAWTAQREPDDGCILLATTLYEAKLFGDADVWQGARLQLEAGRPRMARAAVAILGPAEAKAFDRIVDNPARYLVHRPPSVELAQLALLRMAANDPDAAAAQLDDHWKRRLSPLLVAHTWAVVGRQAALKHQPQAIEYYRRAWRAKPKGADPWSDETLAWGVRAALRSPGEPDRWQVVQRAIEQMTPTEQKEPVWVYWKARALQALAKPDAEGDADRAAAKDQLRSIVHPLSFYGQLATEDLGTAIALPAPPPAPSATEKETARATPGLQRALRLIEIGLRNEGVREWNFTLRGLADRELLAAAQWACEREVWDRCINTSDRTKVEVDVSQRYPMPFRADVVATARDVGIDPAYVYGLIRQESRFVTDARSHVGASGLMQIMPSTARWTAKKLGIDFKTEQISDRDFNLRLGAGYLRLILDDFGGSQALAAAAYNAGPGRPRRWREGGIFEPAAWAEAIPFNETRDYVKKVLANAVTYAALLDTPAPTLRSRLGMTIGPRDPTAGAEKDLP
jgi:soluble lytic murein transglycosylase